MSNNWCWNGEGVRPLSAQKCIVEPHNSEWGFDDCRQRECKIICYYNDFVWLDLMCNGIPVATRTDKVTFRPIKSDRDKAIEDMSRIFYQRDLVVDESFGALYDAGYRKINSEK